MKINFKPEEPQTIPTLAKCGRDGLVFRFLDQGSVGAPKGVLMCLRGSTGAKPGYVDLSTGVIVSLAPFNLHT